MKLDMNNPFVEFISTCIHFILLNLIFLLFCIPIFTIGPALTALYTVTMKESQGNHGYLIRNFIQAFTSNFKQSTFAFLIFFFLSGIFIFNIAFWKSFGTLPASIITVIMIVAAIILLISFIYTFPLLSRYDNTLKHTLKNSLIIGLQNIKKTLLFIAIYLTIIFLCFHISFAALFFLVLGFSFTAYCTSFLFIKVFENYL